MRNMVFRSVRKQKGWSQQQLAELAGVSLSTVERAERGERIKADSIERLCACLRKKPEQLGLLHLERDDEVDRRQANKAIAGLVSGLLLAPSAIVEDLVRLEDLTHYDEGITACRDLYYGGNTHQVEAFLPLYTHQTTLIAQRTSSFIQQAAAGLASQAHQLACELAADRENFGIAQQAGQQALTYAQLAGDTNLQIASLIGLANLGFHRANIHKEHVGLHRKFSLAAQRTYEQAISLLGDDVSPLLRGRVYAGIAEVYAMREDLQESMKALGLAYEYYPEKPEDDPAYPYRRSGRYSLYVFGDAQSRLYLGQPKEAEAALTVAEKEMGNGPIKPMTRVDLLYYQAEIAIQRGDLPTSNAKLTEGATLAKKIGSRLYFNKLAATYYTLQERWPKETSVTALEEVFQPW